MALYNSVFSIIGRRATVGFPSQFQQVDRFHRIGPAIALPSNSRPWCRKGAECHGSNPLIRLWNRIVPEVMMVAFGLDAGRSTDHPSFTAC